MCQLNMDYVQQIQSAFLVLGLQCMPHQLQKCMHQTDLQSITEQWILTIQKNILSSTVSDYTPKRQNLATLLIYSHQRKLSHLECLKHHHFSSLYGEKN